MADLGDDSGAGNRENVEMDDSGVDAAVDVVAAWQEVGERLRAFAYRRVPSPEADDIVQSVMVKLLERRTEVARDSVRAWLFAVTRNAVAEHYRRRHSTVGVESLEDFAADGETDPGDRTIGALAGCLEPMLSVLGPADADILRRVELGGETQTEIARSLGVAPSTIKSRVQRARVKLRAAFDRCCSIATDRDGAPIDFEPGSACDDARRCDA
jgi:RNA polymerase sigma-70 factor, ECF subfamily